eukprot:116356-Amphidinium_carterae.1
MQPLTHTALGTVVMEYARCAHQKLCVQPHPLCTKSRTFSAQEVRYSLESAWKDACKVFHPASQ